MVDRKGRVIPWSPVTKFHWEIAKRAERGFFSLTAKDPQAERWTSLDAFEPDTLAGQELMVLAITDQLMSIGFDPSKVNEQPILSETNPVV